MRPFYRELIALGIIFGIFAIIGFIPPIFEWFCDLVDPAYQIFKIEFYHNALGRNDCIKLMFGYVLSMVGVVPFILCIFFGSEFAGEKLEKLFIFLAILYIIGFIVFEVHIYSKFFNPILSKLPEEKADASDLQPGMGIVYLFEMIGAFFKNFGNIYFLYSIPVIMQLFFFVKSGFRLAYDEKYGVKMYFKLVFEFILYAIVPFGLVFLGKLLGLIGGIVAIGVLVGLIFLFGGIATESDHVVLDDGTKISGRGSDYYDSSGNHYKNEGNGTFRKD